MPTVAYNVYESNVYASLLYESEFGTPHKLAAGLNLNWDRYVQRRQPLSGPTVRSGATPPRPSWVLMPEYTWDSRRAVHPDGRAACRLQFVAPLVCHAPRAPALCACLVAQPAGHRQARATARPSSCPRTAICWPAAAPWHIAPDLEQEEAWNYGVSASFYIPVKDKELTLNAEWYYTHFQNQVVVDLDTDAHAVYFYNLDGRSSSSVFQVEASYPLFRGFTLLGLTAGWTCATRMPDGSCASR